MITTVGLPIGKGTPHILRIRYAIATRNERPATKNPNCVLKVNGKLEKPKMPFKPIRIEPKNWL